MSFNILENNYQGSFYGHWDYSLFKDFKPYLLAGKKRGFLEFLGNVKYIQETNDLLLIKLIAYYRDLNIILKRLLDNYADDMFLRFVFNAKVFGNEARFVEFLQIWDDIFSFALEYYVNNDHYAFDPSYGISYVTFFNIRFANVMSFQTITALRYHNNKSGYPIDYRYSRDTAVVRFSDPILKQEVIDLQYPSDDFLKLMVYQNSSPLKESIV